jgi:deoxyribodipyrimidine photo-lyase
LSVVEAASAPKADSDHFISEIIWREFSYYLLYHFPKLPSENFNSKFNSFPWHKDKENFVKWTKGQTGCPIVDAGMRQLWETGYIHNRVRMIVASFLVKNLLIDWREGAAWFWDCLVDGDLANNSASWQWVAGSGADAAPYFRIFSPALQTEKFDPTGDYIKTWVPELKEASSKELSSFDNLHSKYPSYPRLIVDLEKSRQIALDAYKEIK